MADYRRFLDLNLGHAGILTYIPSDDPENGPGILHTTRLTSKAPDFKMTGSSAELYPPSKDTVTRSQCKSWTERREQERWLSTYQPELFVGGGDAILKFLKQDSDQPEETKVTGNDGSLLALGEMTDFRVPSETKGTPLLAVATGKTGELLRLARIDESKWQWGDDHDAFVHLSVTDPALKEEEAIWAGDGLPILNVKSATTHWKTGSIRWLLVQTQNSVTILQPEYHPVPIPDSANPGMPPFRAPSFIAPTPLITLSHQETGGYELSSVCFNPPSAASPPQIAVIDQRGYWSIWEVLGTWQVGKKTVRLSLFKCGNIIDGFMPSLPQQSRYTLQRHGILPFGASDSPDEPTVSVNRDEAIRRSAKPSRHMLLWNSLRIDIIDLEKSSRLPKVDILKSSRTKPDFILDIQSSPANRNHVFVLTARQVIWLDLLPELTDPKQARKPRILLTCSHAGLGNADSKMSLCQTSGNDPFETLVLIYGASLNQVAVYRFSLCRETLLPQWHRHITCLCRDNDKLSSKRPQFISILPSWVESSLVPQEPGPGAKYAREKVEFYQVTIVEEDLSVQYCICASSTDPNLNVALPTFRIGSTRLEQRQYWRKRRRRYLRRLQNAFVIPDGMTDRELESLVQPPMAERDYEVGRLGGGEDEHCDEGDEDSCRPVTTSKLELISQTIASELLSAVDHGQCVLPSELIGLVQGTIDRGLAKGSQPLISWMQLFPEVSQVVPCNDTGEGSEANIEKLLENAVDPVIITQLRRRPVNEPPTSLLEYPTLLRQFSELWLDPVASLLSEEMQQVRKTWVCETARDYFLSSYGVLVQSVPLFGQFGAEAAEEADGFPASTRRCAWSAQTTPRIASSSPLQSRSASPGDDSVGAAFRRLQLLAPTLKPGPLGSLRQAKVLSYWPTERGVDTDDYVSSVALATEEKFSHAKERLRRIEAKRKAQAEKYALPSLVRQGFPPSDDVGEGESVFERRQRPTQILSSQQGIAQGSSQSQGFAGPSMTMSQPVSGAFGDRKKVKKGRRKSGFR
ncbi:uncharacterized protein UV8b_01323 [Ustilaginoidea virens]|uniref:RNA polymerase I-specific transcription initiation factor RRN6-like protein n=1 Tax=Ustilaginoidea virens TaxID=1159556 RepID=A0A8E5HKQ3_USTVR|nr:uncharacterized protein UV8b_01323 [Ustilaginoidea virens]QUC17082.1 hypothetical protein UV8b_01323 [Ustilaginoidea virens]